MSMKDDEARLRKRTGNDPEAKTNLLLKDEKAMQWAIAEIDDLRHKLDLFENVDRKRCRQVQDFGEEINKRGQAIERLRDALIYLINAHEHPAALSRSRPGVLDHVPPALANAHEVLATLGGLTVKVDSDYRALLDVVRHALQEYDNTRDVEDLPFAWVQDARALVDKITGGAA